MTAHTIGAVNIIANLGPIVGIVSIDVGIINRLIIVNVSIVTGCNDIINIVSTQRPPSSNPRKFTQMRRTELQSTKVWSEMPLAYSSQPSRYLS